ncbi:MAG: hypothetical protein ACLGI7_14955, partial [Gammaproteobacteria bacterium]
MGRGVGGVVFAVLLALLAGCAGEYSGSSADAGTPPGQDGGGSPPPGGGDSGDPATGKTLYAEH